MKPGNFLFALLLSASFALTAQQQEGEIIPRDPGRICGSVMADKARMEQRAREAEERLLQLQNRLRATEEQFAAIPQTELDRYSCAESLRLTKAEAEDWQREARRLEAGLFYLKPEWKTQEQTISEQQMMITDLQRQLRETVQQLDTMTRARRKR